MQKNIELKNVFIGFISRIVGTFQTRIRIALRLLPISVLPLLSVTSAAMGQESATDLIDKVANLEILFCESASSEPMLVSFIFGGEKGPVAVGLGSETEIRVGDNSWTVISGTDVTVFAWPDAPNFTEANFTAIRNGAVTQGRCTEIAQSVQGILKLVSLDAVGKGAMELKIEELQVKITEMEAEIGRLTAGWQEERDRFVSLSNESLDLNAKREVATESFKNLQKQFTALQADLIRAQKALPPIHCQENIELFAERFEDVFSSPPDLIVSRKPILSRSLYAIKSACSTRP